MGTSIIELIALSSIILAAIFGVFGTVTQTKNKEGKLTKWGIVAVAGIIITNSFSFIQTYLSQKEDNRKKIESLAQRNREIEDANRKYQTTIGLQQSILLKNDSALKSQIEIQGQTKKINTGLLTSLEIQKDVVRKQKKINDGINRTLNPILPFAISYSISFELYGNDNSDALKILQTIEEIDKEIKNAAIMDKKYGDSIDFSKLSKQIGLVGLWAPGTETFYEITPNYKNYKTFEIFEKMLTEIEIIPLSGKNKSTDKRMEVIDGGIKVEAVAKFNSEVKYGLYSGTNNFGIKIYYFPKFQEMRLDISTNDITVINDEGKIKSTTDLKGVRVNVNIRNISYSSIDLTDFAFLFPPSYSNKFFLEETKFNKVSDGYIDGRKFSTIIQ
ncbi:MAG: hypothetical protein ACTHLE_25165 [Agriterribacter sp.]